MFTSPKFNKCYIKTLEFEGGKDDDPVDPGGRTAYGIIQKEYDKWRRKNNLPKQDVWKISETEKQTIYWENYWVLLKCEELPNGIDFVMYDFGVNSGVNRAVKFAQKALHLKVDGILGPNTLAALQKSDPLTFIDLLDNMRLSYLQNLGIWWRFGKGWSRRVKEGREYAKQLVQDSKKSSWFSFAQPLSEDRYFVKDIGQYQISNNVLTAWNNVYLNEYKPEVRPGYSVTQGLFSNKIEKALEDDKVVSVTTSKKSRKKT